MQSIAPSPARVAFLGLGRMGLPMARNVSAAGVDLTVWNRTREKADEFAESHGARSALTPAEAVAEADVVITMVADDRAVFEALTGDSGAFAAMKPGSVAVDMSTIAVETARRLADEARRHDVGFLDAPVSGSVAAATEASLTIMVGGRPEALDRARPVLEAMGSRVNHLGDSGSGAAMKLAVNSVVHLLNGAVSEALVLAERSGIERAAAYDVFRHSAIAAPFVHYRQAAFEQPDETPVAFRLTLAAKDLRNALVLGRDVGADLPHTTKALSVLEAAVEAGFADHDESAVAEYLRERPTRPARH